MPVVVVLALVLVERGLLRLRGDGEAKMIGHKIVQVGEGGRDGWMVGWLDGWLNEVVYSAGLIRNS